MHVMKQLSIKFKHEHYKMLEGGTALRSESERPTCSAMVGLAPYDRLGGRGGPGTDASWAGDKSALGWVMSVNRSGHLSGGGWGVGAEGGK